MGLPAHKQMNNLETLEERYATTRTSTQAFKLLILEMFIHM